MSETQDLATAIVGAINRAAPPDRPVEQVSVDSYTPSEVTVRFRRWTAFNGTAYMRFQQAGFPQAQVAELVRQGVVDIVHTRDNAPGMRRAVTK